MRCPTCQVPLNDGVVRIRYRGEARRVSVMLNRVPAQVCLSCRLPVLAPEVRLHVEELAETMATTAGPMRWHIELAA